MDYTALLKPTLHIEILLKHKQTSDKTRLIQEQVVEYIEENYANVKVGQEFGSDFAGTAQASLIESITLVDYTGPRDHKDFHTINEVQLDIQAYYLRTDPEPSSRDRVANIGSDDPPQARVLFLPNNLLKDEWSSLIYDDALHARLLRYLARLLCIMKQPGLDTSTFNWNRIVLLHGPPGSGKSTLCRALAQKLSIRLSQTFERTALVDINTSSLLSKYFGDSGKFITAIFEKVSTIARSPTTLVCVMMDEIETVAGSRAHVTMGGDCSDGLRATNQLLTALDHLRLMPNVIVLCTSNLTNAIDPAFLDRVDIKQLVPSPSPEAIYNIFRSCLNELVRANLVSKDGANVSSASAIAVASPRCSEPPPSSSKRRAVSRLKDQLTAPPSEKRSLSPADSNTTFGPAIPPYAEMQIMYQDQPESPAQRVWALAQACEGFSGRTLRRLPIQGLAMFTWGGDCSLQDAILALTAAVDQELKAK